METGGAACPWTCNEGFEHVAGLDLCEKLCPAPVKKLRMDGGISIRLFARKLTFPALNVKIGEEVCYANMVPGFAPATVRPTLHMSNPEGTVWHVLR